MGIKRQPAGNSEGQAIIEFLVCLVAVLAIFAGLMQVAGLTKAHTDTMVDSRREAAERAMSGFNLLSDAQYILDWQTGNDGKAYTRDDRATAANGFAFSDTVVDRAASDTAGWDAINAVGGNGVSRLRGNATPSSEFGLVNGVSTRSIDLLPAVRRLIYDAPSIELRSEVWMVETGGIY